MSALCKVLIVDDELLIRQGIKHYLEWEEEGFTIAGEAGNGEEALALIEQVEPHIVITDIVMPIMDGEQLTKHIRTRFPHIQVIVLSSFGEFDYVRSTFQYGVTDYILKPKLESDVLRQALHRAVGNMPDFKLYQPEPEELTAERFLQKQLDGQPVALSPEQQHTFFPYDAFWLLYSPDQPGDDEWQRLMTRLTDSFAAVKLFQLPGAILLHMSLDRDTVADTCRAALQSGTGQWVMSGPFPHVTEIAAQLSFVEEEGKRIQFYFPAQLFSLAQLDRQTPESFPLSQFTEKIKRQNVAEALQDATGYIEQALSAGGQDVQEFKQFLSSMIFNMTLLAGDIGLDNRLLLSERHHYFASIQEAKTATEAANHVQRFFDQVQELAGQRDEKETDPGIKRVLAFIEDHYSDTLSLTSVAAAFHFNPSYFSTYFSTHTGEGFNEYVTKMRIEKAVELLQDRSISISEISGRVGYADHSYFCKVFKKQKGMSPSRYRKAFFA